MVDGKGRIDGEGLVVPEETVRAWQTVVDTMAEAVGVPAGLIMRVAGEDVEVFVSSDTEGNPYEIGDREVWFDSGLYCETVIRSGQRLLVPDALADPDWEANPDVKLGMISYMGYPIRFPDGRPFGTICVLDDEANEYSEVQDRLLQRFREMVEGELRLLALNARLERRNIEIEEARGEIDRLRETLPICSYCKKIREDDGYWETVEIYMRDREGIEFSHGICPECEVAHFGETGD